MRNSNVNPSLEIELRERRRQRLWHELRSLASRIDQVVDDLAPHEQLRPELRWQDPRQLELPLVISAPRLP